MENYKIIHKQIHQKLKHANNIALFGHTNIDGDAIGSMLGLGEILEKQGKSISYFTPKKPVPSFDFVTNINKIKDEFDYKDTYDCLLFLDFSGYDRISKFTKGKETYFDEKFLIVIDHHQSKPSEHTNIELKDISAQSTCDLIFELAEKERPKFIDAQIAQHLYLGITTDSGNFIFGTNASSIRTFGNAKKLLEYGADKISIIREIFYQQSLSTIKFIEKILHRTKLSGKILYTYYTEKDLKKYNIDNEQAKLQFNSIVTKTFGPELIILFKIKGKEVGGSLRRGNNTKKIKHNCAKIAHDLFGGGGHKGAAGFTLKTYGSSKKQIKKSLKAINTYISTDTTK